MIDLLRFVLARKVSYAGLTRVSIHLREMRLPKGMGCRVKPGNDEAVRDPPHTNARAFAILGARHIFQPGARRNVMAKGQMRSNKEKKKPKADKNLKKGGAAAVNPFAAGKTPAGQSPNSKKN